MTQANTAQPDKAPFSDGSGARREVLAELNRLLSPDTRRAADEVERISPGHLEHVSQITCADGFKMSVQASRFHYCSPRDSYGPWHAVEIGFPSERVEAFMPYIDGGEDTDPTDTVYGYVPLTIVAQAILDHGGFALSPRSARHG